MKPWNATVTTLVAYECWRGAIAGIDDAGYGCWHKMDWFVYFVILVLVLVVQCLFLQYGDIRISFIACFLILTGDEKHNDVKCILSCGRVLHGTGLIH